MSVYENLGGPVRARRITATASVRPVMAMASGRIRAVTATITMAATVRAHRAMAMAAMTAARPGRHRR